MTLRSPAFALFVILPQLVHVLLSKTCDLTWIWYVAIDLVPIPLLSTASSAMCHLLETRQRTIQRKHHIEHMSVNPFLLISNTPRNHGLIRDLHIFGTTQWAMGVFDF